jgi:hypothetical protein
MTDISSLSAAWSIPALVPRGDKTASPAPILAADDFGAPSQPHATAPDFPKESKVKTERSAPYSFTYTFYDAKTLEIIGQWPQTPSYKLAPDRLPPGVTLQTVA